MSGGEPINNPPVNAIGPLIKIDLSASGFTPTDLHQVLYRVQQLEAENAMLKGRINGFEILPSMLAKKHEEVLHWKQCALDAKKRLEKLESKEIEQARCQANGSTGVDSLNGMESNSSVKYVGHPSHAEEIIQTLERQVVSFEDELKEAKHQYALLKAKFDIQRRALETARVEREVALEQKRQMEAEVHCLRDDLQTLREDIRQRELQQRETSSSMSRSTVGNFVPEGSRPVTSSGAVSMELPRVEPQLPWACAVCTYKNESGRLSCEMCGLLKENKLRSRLEED